MKELIYLDTGFLNSFIAQKEGGLPETTSHETQEQETRSQSTGQTNSSGHQLGATAVAKYTYNQLTKTVEGIKFDQLDAAKEIVSKRLHDDALEKFETYLIKNAMVSTVSGNDNIKGMDQYVYIRSPFRIFDINIFNHYFGERLVDAIETTTNNELHEVLNAIEETEGLNKNQKNAQKTIAKRQSDKKLGNIKNNLDIIQKTIAYLSNILPTDSYLKTGHFISPLKNEYLRGTSKELHFKYGSQSLRTNIVLLGKVTRKFDSLVDEDIFNGPINEVKKVFGPLNEAFEQILGLINFINKGDFIVSPVAIYFEGGDDF